MREFLSMAANRAVDEYAIISCGIPGQSLMERAGKAVVQQMDSSGYLDGSPEILILSGHGNNGGDGYVIAADLQARGIKASLIHVAEKQNIRGDALFHFEKLDPHNISMEFWQNTSQQRQQIMNADVIVDALLGTGISGEIRAPYDTLIKLMNQSKGRCIAVDVPSGVTGDTGSVLDPCIHAELTVSVGYGKQGCLFEPARSLCGNVIPVDIGFPADSLEHVDAHILFKIEDEDFPTETFVRHSATHKYTAGKVFIIAGSKGFTGAALLASTAALRSGAGLVRLALPRSLGHIAECVSLETVVDYVAETETQGLSLRSLPALQHGCEWADTVVIGPGLGRHPETIELVQKMIKSCNKPMVVDADALFALNEDAAILSQREAPTIITPHAGEFKRLIGQSGDDKPSWQDARKFAMDHKISVLLKGAPSILASSDGQVFVNATGYAGMATAGSGDVLSGVIGSLWSQWFDQPGVLNFAMHIHGRAADLNKLEKGVLGLIASDIVEALPTALSKYGSIPA